MLVCDGLLNLSELCLYPGIVFVAMRMQLGQCTQSVFGAVVINEPARRLDLYQLLDLTRWK